MAWASVTLASGKRREIGTMEGDVVTTWPGAPAAEAAHLIEMRKIGCLPVIDEGRVVGIVTEADFVRVALKYFELRDDR